MSSSPGSESVGLLLDVPRPLADTQIAGGGQTEVTLGSVVRVTERDSQTLGAALAGKSVWPGSRFRHLDRRTHTLRLGHSQEPWREVSDRVVRVRQSPDLVLIARLGVFPLS